MFRILLTVLFLIGSTFLYYICFVIPSRLDVNEYEFEVPFWTEELSNLKIVFFSDTHTDGFFGRVSRLEKVIDTINAQNPDIVFYGGDMLRAKISSSLKVEDVTDVFKRLNPKYGTYCVYGNHDWYFGPTKIKNAFKGTNIIFLENRNLRIQTEYGPFWIAFLADYTTRFIDYNATFRGIPENAPCIALSHSPDAIVNAPKKFSIMLSGHTHGGQIKLPFFGFLIVPSDYGQKFALGFIEFNGKYVYTTNGVGTAMIPARFPYNPEICVIKLVPKK